MRLIQLQLENFRQHRRTVIEFHEGMTAIVGANGTGKSTVVEAISYALYGRCRETKEGLRFYWADEPKPKYSVRLHFQFDGKEYVVQRGQTGATLWEVVGTALETRASGITAVNQACERLLGMTDDHFVNSFCAEQKKLGFLQGNNRKRQEEIAKMLGFDRLEAAEQEASKRQRNAKDRADGLEQGLADPNVLAQEKADAAERLRQVEEGLKEIAKQLAALSKELVPAAARREQALAWQKLEAERLEIGGKADGLVANEKTTALALRTAEDEAEELKRLAPKEAEYQKLAAEAREWEVRREQDRQRDRQHHQLLEIKRGLEELDARIKQAAPPDLQCLEQDLGAALQACARAEERRADENNLWQAAKVAAEKALAAAEEKLKQAEKDLKRAEDMVARGVCPECEQELGPGYQARLDQRRELAEACRAEWSKAREAAQAAGRVPAGLQQAELELADAKKKHAEIQSAYEKAGQAAAAHRELLKQRERQSEQAARLEAELRKAPALYDPEKHEAARRAMEEREPDHRRYLALEGCAEKLERARSAHLAAKEALDHERKRLELVKRQQAELPFKGQEEAQRAIDAWQELATEKARLESDERNGRQMREEAERRLAECARRLEEYRAKEQELKQLRLDVLLCGTAASEMRQLREALNRQIRPDLEARACENLNLLTNGRYTRLALLDNFVAVVKDDGLDKEVISGGEEDVVALSLRIALSELIQERNGRPMTLLILDEVFGSLDVERRQCVLQRLSALKGRFRQILVISHIEEINQVADHTIVLERDPATRATVVKDSPSDFAALL